MKCPICGKELEIKDRKIGVDNNGNPIYNKYAICHNCKKMWNLDRQRAHKAAQTSNKDLKEKGGMPGTKNKADKMKSGNPNVIQREQKPEKPLSGNKTQIHPDAARAKASAKSSGNVRPPSGPRQHHSNIPPKEVRLNREKAAAGRKKQPEKEKPVYRGFRIVLGIIAFAGAGLFFYMAHSIGLNTLSLPNFQAPIMIYTVLVFCLLLTGVILLGAQKSNSIFAFLIPMLTSLSGTLFAFMFRGGTQAVLYCAVGSAVLTAILLIITITSRFAYEGYEDEEGMDDEDLFRDY